MLNKGTLALMEKWKQAGQGGRSFHGKGWGRELTPVLGLDRIKWSNMDPLAQKLMIGCLNVTSFRVPYSKILLG